MLLRSRKLPNISPTKTIRQKTQKSKNPENDTKKEKVEDNEANASKTVTSIYFQKKDEQKNIPLKKRRHIAIKVDIANDKWEPPGWKETLENIRKMRSLQKAPVDTLGAHCCADKSADPKVSRFQTLVGLMLSSQTKDEVTHAAVQRLIQHGLSVDNILQTSDQRLGELIYPVGFWKKKVQYLKAVSQTLKECHGGDIPCTLEGLCQLPGVGPKMAHLAMSIAWNQTLGVAVDTHVHRIVARLGWLPRPPAASPEATQRQLESWLPRDHWQEINHLLVGFGQTVCLPVGPKCAGCLNNQTCPSAFLKPTRKSGR